MNTQHNATSVPEQRALVVEDEPVVADVLAQILEALGFTVDKAGDGEEALALSRQHCYAIAVCDLLIPRLNGMSLFRKWEEEQPALARRTLFVTGDPVTTEMSEFVRRAQRCCLFKPFRLSDFAEAVKRIVSEEKAT